MTRKRLKKLLMAEGYDRNCANDAIDQCLADGLNHEEAYERLAGDNSVIAMLLRSSLCNDAFFDGLRELSEAVGRLKSRFDEAVRAFSSVG